MKKIVFVLFVVLTIAANAQVRVQTAALDGKNETGFSTTQPTDVRLLYPDLDKNANEYVQNHPEYNTMPRLNKLAFNFTLESPYSWYAMNLSTSTFYLVPSKCKKVGTYCYVFVEDASWGTRVTQAVVDSVQNAFDNKCPANSSKGIYQMNVDTFGNPPNVDGDDKIVILILDIKDSYTKVGDAYTAGYFHGWNELPKANNYGSNEAEIYYLDCNPLNLTTTSGIKFGMSTTAHEFQHMIMNKYHSSGQTTFLNEACSLIAEKICGYDFREQSSFANDAPQGLFNWRTGTNDVLKDYSRAARFMLYYYEQFGVQFLTKFVQSSFIGITAIDDALSKLSTPTSRRFANILNDWYIANALDDKTVDLKYGYNLTGMPKPLGTTYWSASVNSYSANVPYMGAQIITHKGSLTLNSVFSNCNSAYHKIKAIKFSSGTPVVEDVTLNSTYSVPTFNPTYTSVQYLITNSDQTLPSGSNSPGDHLFTYSSTGTNPAGYEISYDVNAPAGVFNWAAGDTVAVYFEPINGGKIDSLKVWFGSAGTATGGVWEYSGSTNPSPLGKKLLTNMVANPVSSTAWTKIDLRSNNISANKSFAVAFPVTSAGPKVKVSSYPGTSSYHSYTYLNSTEGSSGAGWYYVTKDASNIWLYNMRAYVSVGPVGNEKIVELMPSSYSISQNYPNPFNPSTRIQFSLPEQTKVAIRIYDMLGREIKTLVNSEQSAGKHEVIWNGDDDFGHKVSTGVYMYAISTSKFVQTKKMILLK